MKSASKFNRFDIVSLLVTRFQVHHPFLSMKLLLDNFVRHTDEIQRILQNTFNTFLTHDEWTSIKDKMRNLSGIDNKQYLLVAYLNLCLDYKFPVTLRLISEIGIIANRGTVEGFDPVWRQMEPLYKVRMVDQIIEQYHHDNENPISLL